MTVNEIVNEAIDRLGAGAGTSASDLLLACDEGNKKLYNKLVKVHERLFYGTDTFNTVSGTTEYTSSLGVATDIKRILKLEVRYADQDRKYNASRINLNNIEKMDEISTTYLSKNYPAYYWFGTGSNITIGIVPTPDVSGDDYVKIWYLKQPTAITVGTQTPITPVDAHYLLVDYVFAVAQLKEDEDLTSYLALMNKWERDVEDWVQSEHPDTSEPRFAEDAR